MSHQPERKEKDCLNCGTIVHGRFCHNCGQENIITKQGFWSLTSHFLYDIFHFDGKFFLTLLYLFTRPGFIARRFMEGKRMSYLDPIRMYLFTSAVFFLIFFSLNKVHINIDSPPVFDSGARAKLIKNYEERLAKKPGDSVLIKRIAYIKDTTHGINFDSLAWNNETRVVRFGDREYRSLPEYDSVQAALPDKEKDGWLTKKFNRQSIKLSHKYGKDKEGVSEFINLLMHKLPYLLFLSLPFFALILKLLYIRRRNFYYSDHAIFTLYHYILVFILLLIYFALNAFKDWTGWGFINILLFLLMAAWPVYLFLQMRKFYGQRWFKTFLKFLVLNLLGLVSMVILLILFFILSIFQV